MGQQSLMIKPVGLYSFPNHLATVPPGGLLRADNVVINRDNVVESRRGYKIYSNAMGENVTDTAHQLLNYKDRLLRHWGDGPGTYLDYDNGSGVFTSFSISLTGDLHSNTTIDGLSSTANLAIGMPVVGTDIPPNTVITDILSPNSIQISLAATSTTSAVVLNFTFIVSEVSQGTRIKGIEQNGNFYFTTNEGIKKISAATSTELTSGNTIITQAGGVKALDFTASLNITAPGFFTEFSTLAYRIVWGIKDANNNLILGTPSSRLVVANPTASSGTVDLTITIPQAITTSHFFQIYRTKTLSTINTFTISGDTTLTSPVITNIADTSNLNVGDKITAASLPALTTIASIDSATQITLTNNATSAVTGEIFTITQTLQGVNTDPGDEEQLAYENNPTPSDISNGFVQVSDKTPDDFLGASLYTNENSGDGILQANDAPPLALDITSFRGYTFYSNTSTLQNINIALLSISTLVSGTSTFIIKNGTSSNTYTFKQQTLACTTHGNTTVDGISDTSTLIAGQSITNDSPSIDFQDGTYIVSIDSATQITISQPAITSATTSFVTGYEDASLKYVALSVFATPGQQVDETARSLIRVINKQSDEVLYAYYLSGVNDVPGNMLFQARQLNTPAFYFNVDSTTTGSEFNPNLPVSGSVQDNTSTNEAFPNRIYYSKYQQPEAVPIVNFIDIGPKDKAIIRILALRDNLFVLKEEGVYRLSGLVSPFTVYPFDFSTNIVASDSAVVLNNLIYLYSNQGIATISDTGVAIISRPIEDQLIKLISPQYVDFKKATFGISYESDRAYYLNTVTNTTDEFATQCFRYNTFTQTWTLLDISKRSGIVNSDDDKLYFGPADINFIEQERKLFNRTDYADREYNFTLAENEIRGLSITLPTVTNILPDDVLVQVQYLTLKQFNRLLTKLDNDPLLSPHNYVATLQGSPGLNLSNQLDALIAHVRDDAGRQSVSGHTADASYTALIGTGASSFQALQTCFNNLINLLNNDAGVGYANYLPSSGSISYEFYIVSVNSTTNTITSPFEYPLIAGLVTTYSHIPTELQFVPQTMGDVSLTKQVSEGTFIFEDSSFTKALISYSTDLSASFEGDTIFGTGNGIFGNGIYGEGLFGGNGASIPFRTYLPKKKQRNRYVNCRFQHTVAREIFFLYGISLTYSVMSQRGYR